MKRSSWVHNTLVALSDRSYIHGRPVWDVLKEVITNCLLIVFIVSMFVLGAMLVANVVMYWITGDVLFPTMFVSVGGEFGHPADSKAEVVFRPIMTLIALLGVVVWGIHLVRLWNRVLEKIKSSCTCVFEVKDD